MNLDDKLDRWAQRELQRHINQVILEDADGKVFAFGRYAIIAQEHGARVIKNDIDVAVFSTRATAMSWCIADQHNSINLARKIWNLDLSKRMLQQDLDTRRCAADRSRDANFRERVLTKISTKIAQLNQVRSELAESMAKAKYIQLQGLQHETSRTRRA